MWQGWKISDMMFVTRRSLADASAAVGKQLEQVQSSVVVRFCFFSPNFPLLSFILILILLLKPCLSWIILVSFPFT
jgi:Protein of unknown function (DUF1664)